MLEHDEAGSAVTLPPPAVPVVVLLDSLLPPPQPAAANASAAKMPTSATALKLVLTLPPLRVVSAVLAVMIEGVSGLRRRLASGTRHERREARLLVPWRARRSGGIGRRAGLKIRFPS